MKRYSYQSECHDFCAQAGAAILGTLVEHYSFKLEEQQKNAWMRQIEVLQSQLHALRGTLYFEFTIPRMGKRVDCILISAGVIFVIEFKVGASKYDRHAIEQVVDYALDLKNFHSGSHHAVLVPVLVATQAEDIESALSHDEDKILKPCCCNGRSLRSLIDRVLVRYAGAGIDADAWADSSYRPTPTIIEAAQALYSGHSVDEISRSDSGAINLSKTAAVISEVIERSRSLGQKSICFVTGVPGAGKTLAGLNLATSFNDVSDDRRAVFLSGNGPLVRVLREALARDEAERLKELTGKRANKKESDSKVASFIQNIHHFRDDALADPRPISERVVIFDEAQRAWSREQAAKFMKVKKGKDDFDMSEPEFLIGVLDRHEDWATIVCLIGGGQELNTGEAGMKEWTESLARTYGHWQVYASSNLGDSEYTRGEALFSNDARVDYRDDLHLGVSIRSFRSEKVAALIKAILDVDQDAKSIYEKIDGTYPIRITRNLDRAREWLRSKARGSERFGMVASTGGARLRPHGVHVKSEVDAVNWFLNGADDVRSSYFLEEVASEFDVQGLELDWTCVCWDADLRFDGQAWAFHQFRGTRWMELRSDYSRLYLKNAYRVLLTRARQGMVIFVPHGSDRDWTRPAAYYDQTYEYLRRLGIGSLD